MSATAAAPLRVALFTRYTRLGASSRLRFLQFLPLLAAQGISVDVFPLFDDAYLAELYGQGRRSTGRVLAAYRARLADLRRAAGHDLLWVEKELFPFLPRWLERAVQPRGLPVVVDYDDAVFHNYDRSRHGLVRRLLGRKIDDVMASAACVSAGNGYLADRARSAGAAQVVVVPTVVDVSRYAPKPAEAVAPARPLVIGWIGSPATDAYVRPLAGVLREACAGGRARVLLVGAGAAAADALPGVPVQVQPWAELTEAAQIAGFDIGIMPLPDEPWARGKCGYKLIQYMACGLPVVASPVGVNRDIVEPGVTGFLASDDAQWRQAFEALLADATLRQRLGDAGRQRVEQVYSMQVQGARLAALLREAAATGRGGH